MSCKIGKMRSKSTAQSQLKPYFMVGINVTKLWVSNFEFELIGLILLYFVKKFLSPKVDIAARQILSSRDAKSVTISCKIARCSIKRCEFVIKIATHQRFQLFKPLNSFQDCVRDTYKIRVFIFLRWSLSFSLFTHSFFRFAIARLLSDSKWCSTLWWSCWPTLSSIAPHPRFRMPKTSFSVSFCALLILRLLTFSPLWLWD
jgi:hypothetical protein